MVEAEAEEGDEREVGGERGGEHQGSGEQEEGRLAGAIAQGLVGGEKEEGVGGGEDKGGEGKAAPAARRKGGVSEGDAGSTGVLCEWIG